MKAKSLLKTIEKGHHTFDDDQVSFENHRKSHHTVDDDQIFSENHRKGHHPGDDDQISSKTIEIGHHTDDDHTPSEKHKYSGSYTTLSKHPVYRISKVIPQAISVCSSTNIIGIVSHLTESIGIVRNIYIVDTTISCTNLVYDFLV